MSRATETGTTARRAAIVELVRARRIGTQGELAAELRARGFRVTQGTLSRDLAQLGARRARLRGGGAAYEIDAPARERNLAELVVGIQPAAALVVIHTVAGAAQAIAADLDREHLPAVLGTLAGDDTIFVVPRPPATPRGLGAVLARRFGR